MKAPQVKFPLFLGVFTSEKWIKNLYTADTFEDFDEDVLEE